MRVNIYAEEMTDNIEIISKEIDGKTFTACRFYLQLPATVDGKHYQGPFIHRPGDDDSSAVTFWGKKDLRVVLRKALAKLDDHYPPSTNKLRTEVFQAIGEASMCWSKTPEGVFNDTKASEIGERLMRLIGGVE